MINGCRIFVSMRDVSEIILKRKYFFSQPIQKLFQHLIYREVPEISGARHDRINDLYQNFDNANDVNRSFEYHRQITLKAITLIKESSKRYESKRIWLHCTAKSGLLREIVIWQYINRAVIVRLHERFVVDDINFCFKYKYFDTIYDYLEFETQRGTDLRENEFLRDLSDDYMYEFWYLDKLIKCGKSNNEQKIPKQPTDCTNIE